VKARIERHAPGFLRALRYERLLDPAEYESLHGVSANLAHEIPGADEEALPIESEAPGLFRIGNAVAPPATTRTRRCSEACGPPNARGDT
jgi:hypothetical protein